jgi:hypothetical protein
VQLGTLPTKTINRQVENLCMTEFEGQIKELSKLIYNWNLINVTSISQLDDFSIKLINALNKEENVEKISRIIESELCVTFGLYSNEFDSNILAKQIMQWQDK